MTPRTTLQTLRDRALFFAQTRDFFARQQILDVQVPCIQSGANLDHGINPMQVADDSDRQHFLITSPEHFLKRLLAEHPVALGCITPCFRSGENGSRHNSEFTMAEWYQPHWDMRQLQAQVIDLVTQLSGQSLKVEHLRYRDAFQRYVHIDPLTATDAELRQHLSPDMADCCDSRNDLLDALLVTHIEPQLGTDSWCFLYEYPADQAAQAQCFSDRDGNPCAARFELYWNGIELANGYQECTNSDTIRHVFTSNNPHQHPLDEHYLSALDTGIPPCSGVALGLDRLFMLCHNITDIRSTLSFPWDSI